MMLEGQQRRMTQNKATLLKKSTRNFSKWYNLQIHLATKNYDQKKEEVNRCDGGTNVGCNEGLRGQLTTDFNPGNRCSFPIST